MRRIRCGGATILCGWVAASCSDAGDPGGGSVVGGPDGTTTLGSTGPGTTGQGSTTAGYTATSGGTGQATATQSGSTTGSGSSATSGGATTTGGAVATAGVATTGGVTTSSDTTGAANTTSATNTTGADTTSVTNTTVGTSAGGAGNTTNTTTGSATTGQVPSSNKLRVMLSSDIGGTDTDDEQSMVHFLVYADHWDVEGLLSSPWGDGRKEDILALIDLYEQDYPNLSTHSDYPTPDYLRSVTKQGATAKAPSAGYSDPTEGSEWIYEVASRDDPRPIWLTIWGAPDDLAQVLHDHPEITPKLRVYWIGGPNRALNAKLREIHLREPQRSVDHRG